ncbi:MAG: hypothetical protein HRT87_04740 [Legionellales bacterium]|nr:hypothetical protein [Legionellales bacterium]
MRLLKSIIKEDYHEIEVEKCFLFWKWTVKYRLIKGNVFRFKGPNIYIDTGLHEHLTMRKYFDIKL